MDEPTTRAAKRAATAQRILRAAQVEFGEHGREGTTVRAIAQRAGVDPSLVIQHYGSKNDLFAIASQLDGASTDDDASEHLFDVLGVRLNELPPETRALVRSMLTAPEATKAMKDFLDERVLNLARASDDGDAELRAALTVSSILGLTIARHFLSSTRSARSPSGRSPRCSGPGSPRPSTTTPPCLPPPAPPVPPAPPAPPGRSGARSRRPLETCRSRGVRPGDRRCHRARRRTR
ncbi:TetR family transcriptional regulator [Streptomyces sp. M19]